MPLNPHDISARNAELRADSTLKLLRNAVGAAGIDTITLDAELAAGLSPEMEHKADTWAAADQQNSGRCWIFAGLNSLRGAAMSSAKLKDFEFSQAYIHFYDKLEKANYFLSAMAELADRDWDDRTLSQLLNSPIDDGGQWSMFVALVDKYGVVPKYAMPETASTKATRLMNRNLEAVLHRAAHLVRAGVPGAHEQALRDCYRILVANLGLPPEHFDWVYRDSDGDYHNEGSFTPLEFASKFLPADLQDYVCVVNDPRNDYGKLYTVDYLGNVVGRQVTYLNAPIDVLRAATRASLTDGSPVWFGCDTGQQSDSEKGIWAANLHDYAAAYGVELGISKADRLHVHDSVMTHAMVFTGFDPAQGDKDGGVRAWRVENSWGTDKADKGFWTMADDWFDEYVYEVAVHPSRLPDEYRAALESTDVTVLPAWDPMGALAR